MERDEKGKWKPGTSGNPKGRPKRLTLSELVDKLARRQRTVVRINEGGKQSTVTMTKRRALAERLLSMALNGDMRAIEYLGERLDPRVKTVEADDTGGGPKIIHVPAGGPFGGRAAERGPETDAAAAAGQTSTDNPRKDEP
jgi:hypothetical protein